MKRLSQLRLSFRNNATLQAGLAALSVATAAGQIAPEEVERWAQTFFTIAAGIIALIAHFQRPPKRRRRRQAKKATA